MPAELISVAQLFIKLREHRSLVDYDNSKQWSAADVETVIEAGYAAAHCEDPWSDIDRTCGIAHPLASPPAYPSPATISGKLNSGSVASATPPSPSPASAITYTPTTAAASSICPRHYRTLRPPPRSPTPVDKLHDPLKSLPPTPQC